MYIVTNSEYDTYTICDSLEEVATFIQGEITSFDKDPDGFVVYKAEQMIMAIDTSPRITFIQPPPSFE